MNHKHNIHDTDTYFSINPITRVIKNESQKKTTVMQNDHKSRRFAFEIPRFIEGHDMSLCDKVEVHYINLSNNKTDKSEDCYPVNDMQISPDDENVVIFSWLITGNATKYAGILSFCIHFRCLTGEVIDYAWHTNTFKAIGVGEVLDCCEAVLAEYSDVLVAWEKKIDEQLAVFNAGLENKVDKTTEANKLYGTDKNGNHKSYDVSPSIIWTQPVVQRNAEAQINVPLQPTNKYNATAKEYVDNVNKALSEKQNAIEERVADLESLTLAFSKDTSTAYDKVIPAEVGKYALVKSVGGASEVVKSKNLLNPKDVVFDTFSGTELDTTITNDGAINFTLNEDLQVILGCFDLIEMGLPIGKYYYLFEEASGNYDLAWSWEEVYEEYGDAKLLVQCEIDQSTDELVETSFSIRFMLWQDTSVTTQFYEIAPAPEGTVFEPYFEPCFKNAEVTKVESIGANLFDGSLLKEESKSGLTIQYDEETQTFTINGTATESTSYSLTYINLKGEKGKKYVTKSEIVGGAIDIPSGKYAVAYFGVADEPNTSSNWQSMSLKNSSSKITALNNEYITAFWFYIETGVSFSNLQVKFMLAKADSDIPHKPYSAEPIDSITIPEAVRELDGFGKGVNETYYNYIEFKDDRVEYVQVCEELVLTGNEKASLYAYQGMNGIFMSGALQKDNNKAKGICTDSDKVGEHYSSNSMWVGISGNVYSSKSIYWIGILDILGLSTPEEFKTYLANRYASGNPVRIIYKLAEPIVTDITDLFTEDNAIKVEQGGILRFVNANEMAVPNTVGYVTRKE